MRWYKEERWEKGSVEIQENMNYKDLGVIIVGHSTAEHKQNIWSGGI